MKINFLGATETVTGSKHLLMGQKHNILIDCGLYQGPHSEKYNKEIYSLLGQKKIDALILTHAHLDHCGYIPKLYKDGFRGPIFSTAATYDLAQIVMSDNARIQSSNAKQVNKKVSKEKNKLTPLYTQTEVDQSLSLFKIIDFHQRITWQEFSIEFKHAGHILGASSVLVESEGISVFFSGDIGRKDDLIIHAPEKPPKVDYLVMEATYGDREHELENLSELFKKIFSEAKKKKAAVLIPAFSIGRSQTLMKVLYDFFHHNPELNLPVFVDSPMTQRVTELYYKHEQEHKIPTKVLKKIQSEFHFIQYSEERKKLDKLETGHIILTAAGMLSGGHILHHLSIKGEDPHNFIMITGFQSPDTIGHDLLHGGLTHNLEHKTVNIKAQIIEIKSLSSHADHAELVDWARAGSARKIFLTHGEIEAKEKLAQDLQESLKIDVLLPCSDQTVTLQ